jgi:hypothetical protein
VADVDVLEELEWREAVATAIDALLDYAFEFTPGVYLRRVVAQEVICEALGVIVAPKLRGIINARMKLRGCKSVYYQGTPVFVGVKLVGEAPWRAQSKDKRGKRHLWIVH